MREQTGAEQGGWQQHSPGYLDAVLPFALHTSLNFSGAKRGLFDINPLPTGAPLLSPLALVPLTWKYFSKRTLEVLKVPMVSISITVLKALKDRALAGHRKFPAAPEEQAARTQSGPAPGAGNALPGREPVPNLPLATAAAHH